MAPTPSKVYINLACIDRRSVGSKNEYDEITKHMVQDGNVDVILSSKRRIDFDQVARNLPAADLEKLILVEGVPGVGKSTFAWEFCRRWERGEIAHPYKLVLLFRLRDERMSTVKSLEDLIYHSSRSIREAVTIELESTLGVNTMIILEGFDELPDSCRSVPSVFKELIYGQLLPLATVMVTSRPWATSKMHRECSHRIFQHIEILGFTSQQITEYIERALPESAAVGLSEYLENHPQIRMCMYIPLNSAIVVTVYQESQAGRCALPTTSTELYTALARTLLLRHLHGQPEYERDPKYIQSFRDLPPTVYAQFLQLCELAYSGIAGSGYQVQLIFTGLPSNFDNLGFMDSVTELYVTQGAVVSHNFLHLTVQEYLAALHISFLSPEKQLEHFQRHRDGRFRVVLRFLAGITRLANIQPQTYRNLLDEPTKCDGGITADVAVSQHVRWISEADRGDLIYSVFDTNTMVEFIGQSITKLDCYSLGYSIAHSQCQWVLTVSGEIGEEEVRMLVSGASNKQETSARVVVLRGGKSRKRVGVEDEETDYMPLLISAQGLNVLFEELKTMIHIQELALYLPVECSSIAWPDLSGLRVLKLGIGAERNWMLETVLVQPSLESLEITMSDEYDFSSGELAVIGKLLSPLTCTKHLVIYSEYNNYTMKYNAVATGYQQKDLEQSEVRVPGVSEVIIHDIEQKTSLGPIIAHSQCQWVLTVNGGLDKEEVRMLVSGASTKEESSARVVVLSGVESELEDGYNDGCVLISAEGLNILFKELKYVIHLHELALRLRVECSSIAWPDLSELRVLTLGISHMANCRLDTLLPLLSLESLTIIAYDDDGGLALENCVA